MKSQEKIRSITYMALMIALYAVLKFAGMYIPFLQMPNGGSIELELVPVFVASYFLGWKKGAAVAMLGWLVTFLLGFEMWFVRPMQVLLDYILPLLACGLASLYWHGSYRCHVGVAVAMILKFVSQVLSGVYYWPPEGGVAGSGAAWTYSLSYNLWYNLATLVVCIILVPLLISRLEKSGVSAR